MSQLRPPEHASAGARELEHTADLALELWGPNEPAMLQAGACAVVELLTDGETVRPKDTRAVELEAMDAEDRLVRWLSEVLYWACVEGFLVARAELQVTSQGLVGRVFGQEGGADLLKTEIKAVTYHDLRVVTDVDRVVARVVLDV
ncbi:MAG: archease [Nannocystales bacterium]